jgi:type I restriction-modification system DNA methylase subunit
MDSLESKDKVNKCVNKTSELGQYFTERHITNYIVNKLCNTKENELIKTILDPFSGTGGFSTINK